MADAALRARLEAAQALQGTLGREVSADPPLSVEHRRAIAETSELSIKISTVEAQLAEAVRVEDELLEERARGGTGWHLILGAVITFAAALPGVLVALFILSKATAGVNLPVGVIAGTMLLLVPVGVNSFRLRRGQLRAARSSSLRASARSRQGAGT
jgi:hypothetical protein